MRPACFSDSIRRRHSWAPVIRFEEPEGWVTRLVSVAAARSKEAVEDILALLVEPACASPRHLYLGHWKAR